jgi:hypothetical protein
MMTDPKPLPTDIESAEDDTEGHAASWKVVTDPKVGTRRLTQEWTPDEPTTSGSAGRVTSPRKPPSR